MWDSHENLPVDALEPHSGTIPRASVDSFFAMMRDEVSAPAEPPSMTQTTMGLGQRATMRQAHLESVAAPQAPSSPRVLEQIASQSPFGALGRGLKPQPQPAPRLQIDGEEPLRGMDLNSFGALFGEAAQQAPPLLEPAPQARPHDRPTRELPLMPPSPSASEPAPHAITRPGPDPGFSRSTERTSKRANLMSKLAKRSEADVQDDSPLEPLSAPPSAHAANAAPPEATRSTKRSGILKPVALKGMTLQRHTMTPQRAVPNQVMQLSMRSSIREEPQVMSEDAIQRLYREFLFALRSCGKSAVVDYDAFAAKVRERRAKLKQRHNVSDLLMEVQIKDGKASIEIRPR